MRAVYAFMGRMIMIRKFAIAAVVAAGLVIAAGFAVAAPANADDYPSHPITMIVPLAPGGSTDVLGRIMAQAMAERLRQPVIGGKGSGAAGPTRGTRAQRSAPDR